MSGAAPSALYPDSLLYHEGTLWLKALAGDEALIGLTHFAQNSLGSAVHVELPAAGSVIAAGRSFGLIEADKIAYELVAPASGAIIETNARLAQMPGLINEHPYTEGWLLRLRLTSPGELDALMSAERYVAHFRLAMQR
ncbi:MAG: glycine cleavage system protein H [Lautropia sp.]|nr:MAG: glycine cleavage system protein H [Pseudomonadota bacterium]MBC6958497.1 glycine cleavage system protein H [Lautropia sp.]MCL4700362.1 glycine cleavage system protein H [Burkholderiaceae bacterium]MCZ2415741.1 glycine cleavage system protein H [Burkholderiales bacterium]MDL1906908.1 glycine cleavage system protein H [Betaproteobacteria bacterium PRO1]